MKNKTIILGVTASVAAYKAPEIARVLVKQGARVYPVLTSKAGDFVGPMTLEAVTNQSVPSAENKNALTYFDYLELAKKADAMLIAPATADFIAHITQGLARDLLQTLVLARACPLVVAPAMNENMWKNQITTRNVEKLKELGVHFIGPAEGDLACGDEGIGRLADVDEILKSVNKIIK